MAVDDGTESDRAIGSEEEQRIVEQGDTRLATWCIDPCIEMLELEMFERRTLRTERCDDDKKQQDKRRTQCGLTKAMGHEVLHNNQKKTENHIEGQGKGRMRLR